MNIMFVFGTRPEAIKLAPVIRELKKCNSVNARICVTAQHREMLDPVLGLFEISPDYDLDIMIDNQTPIQVASNVISRLGPIMIQERPDWVLVEGDTTTVAAASIAAFYARIKVGHIEAGLRTYNKWQPFPEEINRRITSVVADMHFAPTQWARKNLLKEGIRPQQVLVTGNPVIDALKWATSLPFDIDRLKLPFLTNEKSKKIILVTAHRRENFGKPLENICNALRELADRYKEEIFIVYAVHLNPNVWDTAHKLLSGIPNIALTAPLDYLSTINIMKRAYLIVTDSGGIQEEAPALGKPVLVLRNITERPEAVKAGTVQLVGTEEDNIIKESVRLLEDYRKYKRMSQAINPYGDGKASARIIAALLGKKISEFRL